MSSLQSIADNLCIERSQEGAAGMVLVDQCALSRAVIALRRIAAAVDLDATDAGNVPAPRVDPVKIDGAVSRDALVMDLALRAAYTRAWIHSQYPITTDFDRGYAKARKDAAAAIEELRRQGMQAIQYELGRATDPMPERSAREQIPVDGGLTEETINLIAADGHRNVAGGIYATSVYEFARAIAAHVMEHARR